MNNNLVRQFSKFSNFAFRPFYTVMMHMMPDQADFIGKTFANLTLKKC